MNDNLAIKVASLRNLQADSFPALVSRAEAYYALGCAEEALADYDQALALKSDAYEVHLRRFDILARLDMIDRMLDAAQSIQAITPGQAVGYFYLGMAFSTLSRDEESVEAYTRAIELAPRHAGAYVNRAAAYSSLGDMDKCLADCEKAQSIDRKSVGAHVNKALALRCLGEQDLAIKVCNQAVSIQQNSPLVYCNRAMAYFVLNKTQNAFDDIDTSIRFAKEPKYAAKCRAIKAYFLALVGSEGNLGAGGGGSRGGSGGGDSGDGGRNDGRDKVIEARELCDSAIRMAPENSYPWRYTWSTSALISAMMGDFDAANRNVELVLNRCKGFIYGTNIQARIYLMQDRLDEALSAVESALARNSKDPEANYIRYLIRARQNDPLASDELTKARRLGYLREQ